MIDRVSANHFIKIRFWFVMTQIHEIESASTLIKKGKSKTKGL